MHTKVLPSHSNDLADLLATTAFPTVRGCTRQAAAAVRPPPLRCGDFRPPFHTASALRRFAFWALAARPLLWDSFIRSCIVQHHQACGWLCFCLMRAASNPSPGGAKVHVICWHGTGDSAGMPQRTAAGRGEGCCYPKRFCASVDKAVSMPWWHIHGHSRLQVARFHASRRHAFRHCAIRKFNLNHKRLIVCALYPGLSRCTLDLGRATRRLPPPCRHGGATESHSRPPPPPHRNRGGPS